jgi:hypothetical protein
MAQLGKIYFTPGGAQLIVTKAGPGKLCDGGVELLMQGAGAYAAGTPAGTQQLALGKRYKSPVGSCEVLINKPGPCDLRYEGAAMELKEAKPLPSSD